MPDPQQPRWLVIAAFALIAFAATMGFDLPSVPMPGHAAWADGFAALAVLATALAWLRGELGHRMPSASSIAALGYVAWVGVCTAQTNTLDARWKLVGIVELVALFVSVTRLVSVAGDALRDRLVTAWIWGVAVLGAIGLVIGVCAQLGMSILPLHLGDGDLGWRFRPAGLQRVGLLAQLCVVPLCVLFVDGTQLLSKHRRWVRALLTVVLVATCTRTLLAMALALGWHRCKRAWMRIALIAALLLAALTAARIDPQGRGRVGLRWRIAESAWSTFRTHPLTGVGPVGNVAMVSGASLGDVPRAWDAHDTPLDVAARYGLPGFALLVATALLAWRQRGRLQPMDHALALAAIATAFDSLSVELADSRHVWLLMGLLAAGRRRPPPDPHAPPPG
jgi:hypothetical protein